MSATIKTFNTVLKDHPVVLEQSKAYTAKAKAIDADISIPDEFNPFRQWGDFLVRIKTQGKCGCCWAMSTAKALAERYAILTLGKLNVELSPYMMVMCEGTVFPTISYDQKALSSINLAAHSQGACNGNSLFAAMDFMYSVGLASTRCINHGQFADYGIANLENITDPESVPMCQSILGPQYDKCLDKNRAVRFYRTIAGYQVDANVEAIKREIYKWGPVASGFLLFDDFIHEYDGTSIYMGPKKGATNQGGHSVEILGWGRENGVNFWWIANSWGTGWGLSGYFRLKMGIPECQLEQNVVGFIPDFPGFHSDMLIYTLKANDSLKATRAAMRIDSTTGYKIDSISEIRAGRLKGDLVPLIRTERLPDMRKIWLGMINDKTEDVKYAVFHYYNTDGITVTKIVLLVLCLLVGKVLRDVIGKKHLR